MRTVLHISVPFTKSLVNWSNGGVTIALAPTSPPGWPGDVLHDEIRKLDGYAGLARYFGP